MRGSFGLYRRLVRASLLGKMQYKANFIITSLANGLIQVVDFLLVATILLRFHYIAGWSIYEVGLLYGTTSIAVALYRLFAPELHQFERWIRQGDFDSLLIRPWPTLLVLLARNIDLERVGGAIQGAVILGISLRALVNTETLNAFGVLYILVTPLYGAGIIFAISLATAALAFWIVRTDEFQVFTMYAPQTASSFPLDIYPGWLRALLFTVLPVAFAGFVPISYLLGKGGGWFSLLAGPIVAVISIMVAYSFWRLGERRYHSTGT